MRRIEAKQNLTNRKTVRKMNSTKDVEEEKRWRKLRQRMKPSGKRQKLYSREAKSRRMGEDLEGREEDKRRLDRSFFASRKRRRDTTGGT